MKKDTGLFRVYRGWNPTQLCGDYKKVMKYGSLLNNQDSMESIRPFFFLAQMKVYAGIP